MDATNLTIVCVTAFAVVFAVLAVLAAVMHLITVMFPERVAVLDGVLVAAISSAMHAVAPGARVTRIEEER